MGTLKYIKQLGSEAIVYGLSGTVTRFIGIFLVPLYTRLFTPEDYGIIAIIDSSFSFLATFVVLGMDSASARWYYDKDRSESDRPKKIISSWFWFQISLSILVAAAVSASSTIIARRLLDSAALMTLVLLSALAVPLNTFKKVLGNCLRYQRRPWASFSYSLSTSLTIVGLTILFVLILRWGLLGIYLAQLIALSLMAIVAILIFRDWLSPRFFSLPLLREMLVFALPLVPASTASWITACADRFFLKYYSSTADIGLYYVSATVASVITLAISAFQMSWGPFAYSILHKPEARQVYSKVFSLYCLGGCWMATALSLFAPVILAVFTTAEYAGASSTVGLLAFSSLAIGISYIAALGCGIAKKSAPISIRTFLGAGVNLALNFILIPTLGRVGAGLSTLCAYSAAAVYLFHVSHKLYPIPYRFRDAWACLSFSWILIGVDHYLLPSQAAWPVAGRCVLLMLFAPLALLLGIVRTKHIQQLAAAVNKRFGPSYKMKT